MTINQSFLVFIILEKCCMNPTAFLTCVSHLYYVFTSVLCIQINQSKAVPTRHLVAVPIRRHWLGVQMEKAVQVEMASS